MNYMYKKKGNDGMYKLLKENISFIITVIVIVLLFNIKLPYYVDTPGGTININNRIEYKDKKEYKGSFNMLYVTEYIATIPTYLLSYVIKDWDLESIEENRISNETTKEIEYRNKIMLENSINTAKYIAYKEANKEIKEIEKKIVVIGVTINNGLKIGDEIIEINGKKVTDMNIVKEEINTHKTGDKLNIKIIRDKKEKEIEVEIKEQNNKKILGVLIVTNSKYETDPQIKLKFKQSESGSSGGMMMTLSIYSAISGENLLKGRKIAGTGTIEPDGTIGEISGIKYKIIGAHRNHMDIVLVPKDNYQEAITVAKERNYKMKIIKVNNIKEAIEYLKKKY